MFETRPHQNNCFYLTFILIDQIFNDPHIAWVTFTAPLELLSWPFHSLIYTTNKVVMDDLSTYRIRIGCFIQRSGSTYKNHKSPSTTNLRGVLAYTVAFLIISGLIAELVINDPGIAINPGPNSQIKYTPTEAKLMRAIKQLNTTIARLSSHRFFNKSCIDLQLTPKTLYNKISHTPAKPHPNLLAKLQHLKDSYTSEALNTYNEH